MQIRAPTEERCITKENTQWQPAFCELESNKSGTRCTSIRAEAVSFRVLPPQYLVTIKKMYNCIVPKGLLQWEIRVAFPGKASCDRVAPPKLRCMLDVLVFP